jgi:hypothetical protein
LANPEAGIPPEIKKIKMPPKRVANKIIGNIFGLLFLITGKLL